MAKATAKMTDGAAAAALVAAGFGSTVLGLLVVGAEMSESLKNALTLNAGVGALSGKTILATVAFIVSWIVLHYLWKDKDVNFGRMTTVAGVLITIGILLTFPPIFLLFASE